MNLDITGKVCPFCLLAIDKAVKTLPKGDKLVVLCDHGPAATGSIPEYCGIKKLDCTSTLIEKCLWEISITKN